MHAAFIRRSDFQDMFDNLVDVKNGVGLVTTREREEDFGDARKTQVGDDEMFNKVARAAKKNEVDRKIELLG